MEIEVICVTCSATQIFIGHWCMHIDGEDSWRWADGSKSNWTNWIPKQSSACDTYHPFATILTKDKGYKWKPILFTTLYNTFICDHQTTTGKLNIYKYFL